MNITARFLGVHLGEGGPVTPTGKGTNFHFSLIMTFNEQGKITEVVKISDSLTCYL